MIDDGNTDQLVDVLQGLDIYQYFFPPPDALALAVVEQGISKPSIVSDSVELAPKLGHFYGALEHANTFQGSIPELLDELGALGYVAEGDHGIEITPEGRTVRTSIKFRPREGLVAKILGRMHFNLTVSPHDIIPK